MVRGTRNGQRSGHDRYLARVPRRPTDVLDLYDVLPADQTAVAAVRMIP